MRDRVVVISPSSPPPTTGSRAAPPESPAAKAETAQAANWRTRLTGIWNSGIGPRPGLEGVGPVVWEFLADGSLLTSWFDGHLKRTLASRWQVQSEGGETAKLRVTGPRNSDGEEGDLYLVTWLGDGQFRLTCLSDAAVPEAEFRRERGGGSKYRIPD